MYLNCRRQERFDEQNENTLLFLKNASSDQSLTKSIIYTKL